MKSRLDYNEDEKLNPNIEKLVEDLNELTEFSSSPPPQKYIPKYLNIFAKNEFNSNNNMIIINRSNTASTSVSPLQNNILNSIDIKVEKINFYNSDPVIFSNIQTKNQSKLFFIIKFILFR